MKDFIKDDLGCMVRVVGWIIVVAALVAVSMWTTCAIAESDLPNWVKYWLLK